MVTKNVLVMGANGALGRSVVAAFSKRSWRAFGVDVTPFSAKTLELGSLVLDQNAPLETQQAALLAAFDRAAGLKFDAVINVAGGWAGGGAADKATAGAAELMVRQSVFTSVVAAHVAATCGQEGVLLVLTGSAAALGPTPGMLGYGLAKAAVHHIVRSVAADPKGLPAGGAVVGALPVTLDTPGNRAGMPDADFSAWTPLETAADHLVQWAERINRPDSGSLAVWKTAGGKTTVELH